MMKIQFIFSESKTKTFLPDVVKNIVGRNFIIHLKLKNYERRRFIRIFPLRFRIGFTFFFYRSVSLNTFDYATENYNTDEFSVSKQVCGNCCEMFWQKFVD